MRLVTCGDSAYYTFLNALFKSNRDTDKLPITLVDWGLQDCQLKELKQISGGFDRMPIRFQTKKRMLPNALSYGMKVVAIHDVLKQKQESILFLDGDFIFTSSIKNDFNHVKDIAVTWLDFRTKHPNNSGGHPMWLNSGFFFCRPTDKSFKFIDKWLDDTKANPDRWCEQDALSYLTRPYFPSGQSPLAHITYLPCTIYNCVPNAPFDKAKLVHMKGASWHEIITGKIKFPTIHRPERLRLIYEKWMTIRYS